MKPLKYGKFSGLNKVAQPEQSGSGDLQVARNVYINDFSRVRRRQGTYKVYAGTNIHSLFSDGKTMLFREGAALKILNADYTATTLRTGLTTNRPTRYLALADRICYTDGMVTGVVQDGASRSWGLEVPRAPRVTATVGLMAAGRYQVALTFVRNDGQESGASPAMTVDVTAEGGVSMTEIPVSTDATVDHVDVYLSTVNGERMFLAMRLTNGTTTATYRGSAENTTRPLATQHMSPPPPGQLLAFYNGRVYIAQDSILWYTDPFYPELAQLDRNFIPFERRVTLLAPATNGVWVGTSQEAGFIAGNPPDPDARYLKKSDSGAIEGTQVLVSGEDIGTREPLPGMAWLWASKDGICLGAQDGYFKNLTEGRMNFVPAAQGTAFLREEEDATQYIVGIFYSNTADLTLPMLTVSGTGTGN